MSQAPDILRRFSGARRSADGWSARCPAHDDRQASLSISERDSKVLIHCHAGCTPEAVCRAAGIEMRDLFFESTRKARRPERKVVARYDYVNESGALLFQVLRSEPKGFSQRRPDGQGGWINNLDGVRRVLYRLPEVLTAEQVLLLEGEKDVETARSLGFSATCNAGGAGKWRQEYVEPLAGKAIIVIADADEPGRKHAQQVAASLTGKARPLKFIEPPGVKDLSEWVEHGGTREQLLDLISSACEWTPPPGPNGPTLLADTITFIRRYVLVSEAQAVAIGLWVVHAHAFEAADSTPYLWIFSAEKQCGKTRLLETLDLLVPKPWLTGRITTAVLVRKIEAVSPTLLLDETDAAFNGDEEYSETLRSVLNTGYRRGGVASCCIGQGPNITWKDFSTFCPKALAGIGKLPDTVADRSLPIKLNRRAKTEPVRRFRRRSAETEAAPIKERAGAWAQKNLALLRNAEPELPEQLSDRQQDCVEPLIAIADLLGGEWPKQARNALQELFTTGQQEQSKGVELLRDIRAIFEEQVADKLASEMLVQKLVEIETSPWGEWNRGKGLTKIQLARLLRPFEIAPRTIRSEAGGTAKGYHWGQFSEAWDRYLSCLSLTPPLQTSQASQASIDAGADTFFDSSQGAAVTDRKSLKSPVFTLVVTDVTDRIPGGEKQPAANWYRPEPLPGGGWRCECGVIITDPIEWSKHTGIGGCPLKVRT